MDAANCPQSIKGFGHPREKFGATCRQQGREKAREAHEFSIYPRVDTEKKKGVDEK